MKVEGTGKSTSGSATAQGPSPKDATKSRQLFKAAYSGFESDGGALLSSDDLARQDSGRMDLSGSKDEGGGNLKKKADDKSGQEERILASAGLSTGAAFIDAMGSAPAPTLEVAAGRDFSIDELVNRIDQAMRLSLHAGGDSPLKIKIGLNDLDFGGLSGLELTVAKSVVEVALVRVGTGDPSPQIAAAAQALASQLAVRMPNRVIRIVDRVRRAESEQDSKGDHGAMQAIAGILSGKRGGQ